MSRTSPNFSKMSDTYIPELIELNSYWQNAVEEAIQDTLKGEKRLYYALKNRKKVKQELRKLGLKPQNMESSLNCRELYSSYKDRHAVTKLPDHPRHSYISHVFTDPEKSRSRSRTRGETPQKYRNPERPLLGDSSLEKMKKSQNDFNYEPMGTYEGVKMMSTSESEKEDSDDDEEEEEDQKERGVRVPGNGYKNIEWIHMRENSNFEDSDSEVSYVSKRGLLLKTDLNKVASCSEGNVREKSKKIPINFDPRGDLFWENEVKNAIRANANFERKLQLALAKREILKEHQAVLRLEEEDNRIEIKESEAKNTEKKQRGKMFLSPFVRFYLDVYRELCLKCPMKEIGEEAARRWWIITMKKKSEHSTRKSRK